MKDSRIFLPQEKILAKVAKNTSEEPRMRNHSRKIRPAIRSEEKIQLRRDEGSVEKVKESQSLDLA